MKRIISLLFLFSVLSSFSADRYWVGGGSSTNWNATGPTNWSATSGGPNNASVPGSADNVFFDSNGNTNSTISASTTILKLFSNNGYTATLTHNAGVSVSIVGNGANIVFLSSAFTYVVGNATTSSFRFTGTGGNILCNKTLGSVYIENDGSGIGVSTYPLVCSGNFEIRNGTLTLAANLTARVFSVYSRGAVTLNLNSYTVEVTGRSASGVAVDLSVDDEVGGTLTLNAGTSTFKLTDGTSGDKYIATYGLLGDFNNIWLSGTGTGTFIFYGLNCNELKIDNPPHVLEVFGTLTLGVTTFNINGTAGNLNTIRSRTSGSAFNLTKSTGTVNFDYVSFKDVAASGGATFNASLCTNVNVSGNSGINFTSCTPASNGNFFLLLK